jgi:hypothetical protein
VEKVRGTCNIHVDRISTDELYFSNPFDMNTDPRFCILLMSAGTEKADNSGNKEHEIIFDD